LLIDLSVEIDLAKNGGGKSSGTDFEDANFKGVIKTSYFVLIDRLDAKDTLAMNFEALTEWGLIIFKLL